MEPCKVTSGAYIKRFCKEYPFETSISRLARFSNFENAILGGIGIQLVLTVFSGFETFRILNFER